MLLRRSPFGDPLHHHGVAKIRGGRSHLLVVSRNPDRRGRDALLDADALHLELARQAPREAVGLLREHVCRGKRLRVIGYEDRAHVVDGNQQRAFPDGLGEVGEQTDCLECVCRWQRKPHRPGAVARPCKRGGAILDDGIDAGAQAPEAARDRDRTVVKGVRRESQHEHRRSGAADARHGCDGKMQRAAD